MHSVSNLYGRCRGKCLTRLFALLLALAIATPVLLAQEWDRDHLNGRDKVHDPTGAWLVRFKKDFLEREFFLIVFHKGGTLTQDVQGESAFDVSAVNLPEDNPNYSNNVIGSPLSGVWQKTGWNTFAGTLISIEYNNSTNPRPRVPLFDFTKQQITGRLTESGDQMVLDEVLLTHFDSDGKRTPEPEHRFEGLIGVRVPLKILPNSSDTLPVPPIPQ